MNTHLIVVGKLKDKHLESIENDYLKRIINPKLLIHEVKAQAENKDLEAQAVLKKIQDISKGDKNFIIALCEFGKQFESPDFSKWVYDKIEKYQHVFFIIAGANGHGQRLLDEANEALSLSRLTFPHKMARVLLVEQIYRSMTIRDRHPYHN